MFRNIYLMAILIFVVQNIWAQNNCGSATSLSYGVTSCGTATDVSGSFGNSSSADNPCNGLYNDDEYWFEITGTGGTVDLDLTSLGSDWIGLYVLDACPSGSPSCIASDANTSATTDINLTTPVLTSGVTYYVVISTFGPVSGTPSFCLTATDNSGGGGGGGGGGGVSTPGGDLCADVEPICTANGISFTANDSGTEAETVEPGNDYGCLVSSPDPAWYYLDIGVAGNIDMTLSAPNDVDFALWGPFTDLATAQASCGALPAPIDCSYDASNTEDVNITGAQVGEVYILLITNYDGSVQLVDLNQTGGSGATNCADVCGVDIGTTTATMANTSSNDYVLCPGESVDLSTVGSTPPTPADIAGVGYLIYTDNPTVTDPDLEPNWTGYYYTGSAVTETNTATNAYEFILLNPSPTAGANGVPSNNQLVFIPITMDDIADIAGGGADDNLGHDIDGDGCYEIGTPILVTYLDDITSNAVETCGVNVVITLSGGYPGVSPGATYTVNSTGAGTMAQSGSQGETLTFTGLNTGDVITVDVTNDGNGCTQTITFTATCPTSPTCGADAGNW
ncbi:MAG: hypothetical protein MK212_14060 [Saprospiraceae bacterium]|nr:hypothetical protein [Saprospiraceae bacterium]